MDSEFQVYVAPLLRDSINSRRYTVRMGCTHDKRFCCQPTSFDRERQRQSRQRFVISRGMASGALPSTVQGTSTSLGG